VCPIREVLREVIREDEIAKKKTRAEVLRAFGPYKCPLGLGCDNGNIWDAQKNGVVRCECIKRKFARNAAAEAATP
jgi:hypothetical protein